MRFELSSAAADEIADLTMRQNLQTLRNRVDELGVAEPVITRQGRDRIAVQLPGVQDTAQAKKVLGRTAALELRGVDGNKSASPSMIRRARAGRLPRNLEMFEQRDGSPLIVLRKPVITGEKHHRRPPGLRPKQPSGGQHWIGRGGRRKNEAAHAAAGGAAVGDFAFGQGRRGDYQRAGD